MSTATLARVASWLDELPQGWEPLGLREALDVRAQANTRLEEARQRTATSESSLASAVADGGDVDGAALQVLIARTVLAAIPPVPEVPTHYGDEILGHIRQYFRDHPAQLGSPPLILSEQRHFLAMHAEERTPGKTDYEHEVCSLFEGVAGEVYRHRAVVAQLTADLDGQPIESRVVAWSGFRPVWEAHRELCTKTRAAVETADAERLGTGRAHRCIKWNNATCGPLLAVDIFPAPAWTEARSMHDGIPVSPAH